MTNIELMKQQWDSKHALMTDIMHTLKSIVTGTHDSDDCIFCEKSNYRCKRTCPVSVIWGLGCGHFRVFNRYYYDKDRSPVVIAAIVNKLIRMALRIGEVWEEEL
jgi:hypothetical protein